MFVFYFLTILFLMMINLGFVCTTTIPYCSAFVNGFSDFNAKVDRRLTIPYWFLFSISFLVFAQSSEEFKNPNEFSNTTLILYCFLMLIIAGVGVLHFQINKNLFKSRLTELLSQYPLESKKLQKNSVDISQNKTKKLQSIIDSELVANSYDSFSDLFFDSSLYPQFIKSLNEKQLLTKDNEFTFKKSKGVKCGILIAFLIKEKIITRDVLDIEMHQLFNKSFGLTYTSQHYSNIARPFLENDLENISLKHREIYSDYSFLF